MFTRLLKVKNSFDVVFVELLDDLVLLDEPI